MAEPAVSCLLNVASGTSFAPTHSILLGCEAIPGLLLIPHLTTPRCIFVSYATDLPQSLRMASQVYLSVQLLPFPLQSLLSLCLCLKVLLPLPHFRKNKFIDVSPLSTVESSRTLDPGIWAYWV